MSCLGCCCSLSLGTKLIEFLLLGFLSALESRGLRLLKRLDLLRLGVLRLLQLLLEFGNLCGSGRMLLSQRIDVRLQDLRRVLSASRAAVRPAGVGADHAGDHALQVSQPVLVVVRVTGRQTPGGPAWLARTILTGGGRGLVFRSSRAAKLHLQA